MLVVDLHYSLLSHLSANDYLRRVMLEYVFIVVTHPFFLRAQIVNVLLLTFHVSLFFLLSVRFALLIKLSVEFESLDNSVILAFHVDIGTGSF